jgi:HEAT repeat protein
MGLRKTQAASALREVVDRQPPRDLDGLLRQLEDADRERRRWAARDLATHPSAATALGRRLEREADPSVRQALFTSLAGIAGPDTVEALVPLLRSDDPGLRNGALEALAAMPDDVAPRVDQLLRDADPDVRIFTVNLVGELRHPRVRHWLIEVMRSDASVNVVSAAVEAMAEAGEPQDVPALQAVARRFGDDPFVAFAVDMAVERVQSGGA